MRGPAALSPVALAVAAIILVPVSHAHARDAEQGPIEIEKCQTISNSGSYKLIDNLTFKGPTGGTCLLITADAVTIDLAGFTISGPFPNRTGTAIAAGDNSNGIAVRNGSISDFSRGVDLRGNGSIVEGLRVFRGSEIGIAATGIVRGNTVVEFADTPIVSPPGVGIAATEIVTGNYTSNNRVAGLEIGQGSTVIGNTATNNDYFGILVSCPANVTDNTAVGNNAGNLSLQGQGCNNTNNVAP